MKEKLWNEIVGFVVILIISYVVYLLLLDAYFAQPEKLIYYELLQQKEMIRAVFSVFWGIFGMYGAVLLSEWLSQIWQKDRRTSQLISWGGWFVFAAGLWGNFLIHSATFYDSPVGSLWRVIFALTSGKARAYENFIFGVMLVGGLILLAKGLLKLTQQPSLQGGGQDEEVR